MSAPWQSSWRLRCKRSRAIALLAPWQDLGITVPGRCRYALEHIQLGACGTRAWSRGEILWAANTGMIIVSIGVFISALIYFQFMLVPLTSAYFFVFLFSPIMNILMFRPIECGPVRCCDPWEEDPEADEDKLLHYPYGKRRASEGRREMEGAKASCMDIFTLAMVPPGLALLVTMVVVFAGFGLLVSLISGEVGALLADEAFMQKLTDFVDQLYVDMNSSGVKVLRYSGPEGYTAGEIGGFIGQFGDFFNQVALIFLLTIYVMSEKTMPTLFSPTNKIMMEIETQVMGYISLKTALSFVTGVIVAIILLVLGVKLAIMFGLLSFVLNFIPNVGSMIAMFLPLPIVIVDDGLATWQKIGSFVGPGIVQGYVGNALEPMVFGKSLNSEPFPQPFSLLRPSLPFAAFRYSSKVSTAACSTASICCARCSIPSHPSPVSHVKSCFRSDRSDPALHPGGSRDLVRNVGPDGRHLLRPAARHHEDPAHAHQPPDGQVRHHVDPRGCDCRRAGAGCGGQQQIFCVEGRR